MIGAVSGFAPMSNYYTRRYAGALSRTRQAQNTAPARNTAQAQPGTAVTAARRAADPNVPVQPVRPVSSIPEDVTDTLGIGLRRGVDPVEMAVRMRIQYADGPATAQQAGQAAGQVEKAALPLEGEKPAAEGEPVGAESVQKTVEESQCQTCKERKYQDGSDDSGVSYQTPTHIDPDLAPSAVRSHEQEHVVREQAKAGREDRRVVSQTVSLHTDICPECGRVYISGGTTRTTTAAARQPVQPEQSGEEDTSRPTAFSAVA